MSNLFKLLICVIVLEYFKLIVSEAQARPLNGFDKNMLIKQNILDGIKHSGPSYGGEGHSYTNAKTLGGRKISGPSPDVGHKFTTVQTLKGIEDSVPYPGVGHKYTNVQALGGIKDSGPSPGAGH